MTRRRWIPQRAQEAAGRTPPDVSGISRSGSRASRILTSQIATARLREDRPDWLLQIPVPEVGMFDFHRTAELVEVGRRHAEASLPELRRALARAVPLRRRLRDGSRRAGALLPEL